MMSLLARYIPFMEDNIQKNYHDYILHLAEDIVEKTGIGSPVEMIFADWGELIDYFESCGVLFTNSASEISQRTKTGYPNEEMFPSWEEFISNLHKNSIAILLEDEISE
jgi:hypothetical protein